MRTLLLGGSGPTGPHVVSGLLERGHDVTILHRGLHEVPDAPPLRHIHADPHFEDSLVEAVGEERFDLVLAMYGRLALSAKVFAGRCDRIIGIGGTPVYRGLLDADRAVPRGMALLAREEGPLVELDAGCSPFAEKMRRAEAALFDAGEAGAYAATLIRYPQLYGPRNVLPMEWTVVRRVLDGRATMVLPDDGLWVISRCAARNAAALVLAAVDGGERAVGKAFNAADDDQHSVRQWAEIVATSLGTTLEFVGIPAEHSGSVLAGALPPGGEPHMLVTAERARVELGYRPVVTADQALAETARWLVDHPVTQQSHPVFAPVFDYEWEDRLVVAYRRAAAAVAREVPPPAVHVAHPMPHPKKPSLSADELGR